MSMTKVNQEIEVCKLLVETAGKVWNSNDDTISAIKSYVQHPLRRPFMDWEELTLALLNSDLAFEDQCRDFKFLLQGLLGLLTDPAVAQKLNADWAADSLFKLLDFFEELSTNKLLKAKMNLAWVETMPTDSVTAKRLHDDYLKHSSGLDFLKIVDRLESA